jgi:hypothetical protein
MLKPKKKKKRKKRKKPTLSSWCMVPTLSMQSIILGRHPGQRNCTSNPSSKKKNNKA